MPDHTFLHIKRYNFLLGLFFFNILFHMHELFFVNIYLEFEMKDVFYLELKSHI